MQFRLAWRRNGSCSSLVLRDRALNPPRDVNPRFSDVASLYHLLGECVQKSAGQCIGVRWDYAFFQMLVETNYLTFTGGVRPQDNNFAGIGVTVAGKPGETFASVRDGVLAHLQHLLMYAGVVIEHPIERRASGEASRSRSARIQSLARST